MMAGHGSPPPADRANHPGRVVSREEIINDPRYWEHIGLLAAPCPHCGSRHSASIHPDEYQRITASTSGVA